MANLLAIKVKKQNKTKTKTPKLLKSQIYVSALFPSWCLMMVEGIKIIDLN